MENKSMSIVRDIARHAGSFVLVFALIFILSFLFLLAIGAVPIDAQSEDPVTHVSVEEGVPEQPVRIVARAIKLDEEILNPESRDIVTLDKALLKGVVRYPGSALLGEQGNTLLFGHSSYLSVVHNSAYKAFNDIQKLKTDDTISVYSEGREYRYRVTSVRFVNAQEGVIDMTVGKPRLTLVTCDSFGKKSDRFVVEADFVGSYPVTS